MKFIYTPIPKHYSSFIRCGVRRDRSSLEKGFFPRFYFFAERPGDGKKVSDANIIKSLLIFFFSDSSISGTKTS